jgi:hypothetical protein
MTRIVFITRGRTTGLEKGGNLFLNSILCGVYGEIHSLGEVVGSEEKR